MDNPEKAAIRRRWINLGEALAVVAVLISGATLWLNWSERRGDEAEKAAESSRSAARTATLILTATPAAKGARLDLAAAGDGQVIADQRIRFPGALGIAPVQTTGESRIEARWFDAALRKARDKAGRSGAGRGDERLPVVIDTRYLADGRAYRDIALYDIGYTVRGGGLFGGEEVTLRGLSLVRRVTAKDSAALDARWAKLIG